MEQTPSPALQEELLGLNADEVLLRVQKGATNAAIDTTERSTAKIILSNVFSYFNILFFVLALCLIFVGSGVQNLLFLLVVFCNTAISIVQELRAARALKRLSLVNAPRAVVLRDAKQWDVPSEDLVQDDVILLSAGDQIPADAVVLKGFLTVNESLLTGEADEIAKQAGDTLLSGSFVVAGKAAVRLTRVGKDSFAASLSLEAKKVKRVQKPGMMRSLSLLVRILGVLILPLGGVLFYQQVAQRGTDIVHAMESSVSSVIGMVPEGLYLLASTALALAVIRLTRRGTLTRDLSCVEALARVDTLCVDKTGTITEENMHLSGLFATTVSKSELSRLLGDFAAASDAKNPTIQALSDAFKSEARTPLRMVPFSSRYKFSAVAFSEEEVYVLGAPDVLLSSLPSEVEREIENGVRVLAFCRAGGIGDGALQGPITPLGFVYLQNRVRENARETFSYFAEQGVAIKVISGDHPLSVSRVAQEAGIEGADRYVDASALSDEELSLAVEEYTVFGRVNPHQKRVIVRSLKKHRHTVAMTGDGVNDVLALKDADCSIAMASGSDAASSVAQIVLTESDFSALPAIVAEGRQVINNIERSATLYLVKNIFSFCSAILLLFAPLTYPLQPVQLSLLSTLTIGVPSFFLALETNHDRIRGTFLRNVLARALPAGLCDFFLLSGMMVFSYAFPTLTQDEVSTVSILVLCTVGFLVLFTLSRPMNVWRGVLFGLLVCAFVVAVLFFSEILLLAPLSLGGWIMFILFFALAFPLYFGLCRLQAIVQDRIHSVKARRVRS